MISRAGSANRFRFMNLNDPGRPLSTEDPTFDTYLPVDDTAWDDCVSLPPVLCRIGYTNIYRDI
jgi:hypothetical protein